MPVWEDVKAAFDEARPVLADAFHSADYEIVRMVEADDGYGGRTTTPKTVETGKCSLDPSTSAGVEGASGPLTLSVSDYRVEMPKITVLTASDTLYVNGRKFNVTTVLRGDDLDIFPVANVEEAS